MTIDLATAASLPVLTCPAYIMVKLSVPLYDVAFEWVPVYTIHTTHAMLDHLLWMESVRILATTKYN